MAKDWLKKLHAMEGAVTDDYNPHNYVLQSRSPAFNFCFGKGWGLPFGYTLALAGAPKSGKTLGCYDLSGQLHADDPTAEVVHLNTEHRARVQSTAADRKRIWGIQPERFHPYEVNAPEHIFDRIEQDFAALCQDGWPLKLVIIDSIDGIMGRRSMNAESVNVQQIGDWAQTVGDGFKRILPVQRKYKFAVIMTCQIRTEMDQLEQRRGNKIKMKLPLALQHYAEYFMFIEQNRNAEGRTDLSGNNFLDDTNQDMKGQGDQEAHKILFKMKDSSCGPKGRSGQYTLNYKKGIINVHEEVFTLAHNRGIFECPNNRTYIFGDQKWVSKEACLEALRSDSTLQVNIIKEIKRRDQAGAFAAEDIKAELEVA